MMGMLFSLAVLYVVAGLAYYLYLVVKTYTVVEFWSFKIDELHVGIYRYPRWLMAWMYHLAVKMNGGS